MQKIEEVSSRLHYLIKDGIIPLPAFGKAEVLLQQARLMLAMRQVFKLYVESLALGDTNQARLCMRGLRYLEEGSCRDQFEKFGYPEEEASTWDQLIAEYQPDKINI